RTSGATAQLSARWRRLGDELDDDPVDGGADGRPDRRRRLDQLCLVALDLLSQYPDWPDRWRAGAAAVREFPRAGADPLRLCRFRDRRARAVSARIGDRECRAPDAAAGTRHRLLPARGDHAAHLLAPRPA